MGTTRRPLFAFAILLTGLPVSAQFDALPDSNAAWTETFWIGPGYPYEGFFHTYDTTSPDTVYNGNVYQKLLTTYSNNFIIWGTGYGECCRSCVFQSEDPRKCRHQQKELGEGGNTDRYDESQGV